MVAGCSDWLLGVSRWYRVFWVVTRGFLRCYGWLLAIAEWLLGFLGGC